MCCELLILDIEDDGDAEATERQRQTPAGPVAVKVSAAATQL
jgi:hypothetical protein